MIQKDSVCHVINWVGITRNSHWKHMGVSEGLISLTYLGWTSYQQKLHRKV